MKRRVRVTANRQQVRGEACNAKDTRDRR